MLKASAFDSSSMMEAFDVYNKAVMDFFASRNQLNRLWILDLANASQGSDSGNRFYKDLCSFIGPVCQVPRGDHSFPHANSGSSNIDAEECEEILKEKQHSP